MPASVRRCTQEKKRETTEEFTLPESAAKLVNPAVREMRREAVRVRLGDSAEQQRVWDRYIAVMVESHVRKRFGSSEPVQDSVEEAA